MLPHLLIDFKGVY